MADEAPRRKRRKPDTIVDRTSQWGGKPLSAILQILRSAGVTRYQTPDFTIELGPPTPRHAPTSINISPDALASEPDDEDEGDPRFLLERMGGRFFRKHADPAKNKAPQ